MKAVGIVRKIDALGRLVLPIELRRTLGIEENDPLEMFTTEEGIVIRPYQPGCSCCGCTDNLLEHIGVALCQSCVDAFVRKSAQGAGENGQ